MMGMPRSRTLFVIIFLLAGLLVAAKPPSSAYRIERATALALPPGFVDEPAVTGLFSPRAFAFTPDGRILIAERGSATSTNINVASLRVFKGGVLLPARAVTLNVCGDGERGLLGVAVDPNFVSNGYLYVYYTRQAESGSPCVYNTYTQGQPGPRNRVSRLTMLGDTIGPASERILVDNIPSDSGIHNAGDLHFGADGYLYVSVGNSNLESPSGPCQEPMSQDLTCLGGKILRIHPTDMDPGGYTTTGNPFDSDPGAWRCGPLANPPGTGPGPCKEIYAYGFRNPFRFAIKPGTSTPYVGDVGGGVWEEVDEVTPGGNYGYPMREGPCSAGVLCVPPEPPTPGLIDPIYYYPHSTIYVNSDSAIIAGDFYTGLGFPAEYRGNFYFADFVRGFIRRLAYDSLTQSWNAVEPDFATGGNSIIGLRTGPDGSLYYLAFTTDQTATNEIRRIRYAPGTNQAPIAQLSADPLNGPLSTLYTFSAVGSHDPDNNLPLVYHWDLGDSTVISSTSAITVTHTYTLPGAKSVTLTVLDSGVPPLASIPVTVTVFPANNPPTATIVLTNTTDISRTSGYYAGDTWQFAAAHISDDQVLPPGAFSWDVVFHHRTHTHPFLSGLSGPSGQFTIPPIGEIDPVVWYRITLHLTDAQGQATSIDRDLYPITSTLTLQTSPPGGQVILDGAAFLAPRSVTRVVGMNVGIGATSPQQIGGNTYQFAYWSDGGSQTQLYVVPAGPHTLTAVFAPPYLIQLPIIFQ